MCMACELLLASRRRPADAADMPENADAPGGTLHPPETEVPESGAAFPACEPVEKPGAIAVTPRPADPAPE